MTSQMLYKMLTNKKPAYKRGDDITAETKAHYTQMGYGKLAEGIESSTYVGDIYGDGVPMCVTVWRKHQEWPGG